MSPLGIALRSVFQEHFLCKTGEQREKGEGRREKGKKEVKKNVLIRTDTSGFQSLGAELFVFIGDHVDAERKFVDVGTFAAEIKNADLGVGNTTVEARLRIWLYRGT